MRDAFSKAEAIHLEPPTDQPGEDDIDADPATMTAAEKDALIDKMMMRPIIEVNRIGATNLEQAAYEWVEAVNTRMMAGDLGEATYAQLAHMSAIAEARKNALLSEAQHHFDKVSEGGGK